MYGYEHQDSGERAVNRAAIAIAVAVAAAALGWFVVRPALDEEPSTVVPIDESRLGGQQGPTNPATPSLTTAATATTPTTTATTEPATTEAATTEEVSTTAEPTTTEEATTTTRAPRRTTTTESATTTTAAKPREPEPQPYPTLPDGSPEPVVAIFDYEQITLSGNVPTEADKEYAAQLAIANSKFPDVALVNQLTVNPSVPKNIGARVVELTSARFPEHSAQVIGAHALELDRVVNIMNSLPRVTALVVGHSDQRGDEASNFALSEDRAQAVVSYLVSKGINPTRLSSRAVGEGDLLSINNDAAALALNRRTEFIFYGLLLR